jgi:DNA-binding NarL/FixJ family response regulator
MRQGLTQALASEPEFEVVGEAADGVAAVELAKKLRPDLIVMDVVLPRLNGIDATRQISKDLPQAVIIGVSVYPSRGYAARMLEAGARAYVLKDSGPEDLLRAIRAVRTGQTYLSPGIEDLDV